MYNFCMFVLYLATLLNSLICSRSWDVFVCLFTDPMGFTTLLTMSFANRDSFISSFLICMNFNSFLCYSFG